MKKALIIIAAVFGGLVLLLIVGAVVGEEKQPIVIVASPAPKTADEPVPTPAAQPDNGMAAEEQVVYDFISVEFPKLRDMNDKFVVVLDGDSYPAMLRQLRRNSTTFLALTERWNRIDWGYGAVGDLEDDFDVYMNATRTFYRNWLKGVSGGNTTTCATNAVKAERRMDDLVPRIEAHLGELRDGSY